MEMNPNHPMTEAVRDQWHKIVVLLMIKLKKSHVEITQSEIEQMTSGNVGAVTIQAKDDRIILNLVSPSEAAKLARKEGGLAH